MTATDGQGIASSGYRGLRGLSQFPAGSGTKTGRHSNWENMEKGTEVKKVIGFSEIKEKYLPHRYPIIMLDRITDYRTGEYVEAIKCVTGNSPELVGHFPDRAIMPATQVVQGFAQLAIIFFKLSMGQLTDEEMTLITSVKFRFLAPIYPGDTL